MSISIPKMTNSSSPAYRYATNVMDYGISHYSQKKRRFMNQILSTTLLMPSIVCKNESKAELAEFLYG